ncbi:ABC transporter substrate-binding protein [Salinibacterium xinjiangense]|uniref:Monosaccharide ABC transporter substrate-binding protein, CUT2 family n=1 Tax=Salinibacterium xinjiangense TaxID=386302 RepID=A0A2C8YK08_9MICO|nr:sugar ABC transporter substrate-binding protein [Salinibacterium xinjiangense]GGK97554.1 ABC transporter substrate-binding protein [Salinibacterium xinjiangense]SOE50748.1 monosaccharide ABC transporter substrate-binding protein, CUT2 family [Salinibacterium xinjiangense]
MKLRIAAIVASSATILLIATGCSVPSDTAGGGDSTAAPTREIKKIFFSNILPSYPPLAEADKCFLAEAKKLGIEASTSGPTGLSTDNAKSIDLVSQAIATGYDAIVMQPIDKAQFTPVMEQAQAAGILLATMNTGDTTDTQDFTIGTDYAIQGATIGEAISKRSGQQNIGIIGNAPTGTHLLFTNGVKDGIESQKLDNVKFIVDAFDDGDPNKTVDVVNQMLTAHPEINVVLSWQGLSAAGIMTAIKEKNAGGKIVGVTNDVTPEVAQGIKDGILFGTSKQNFCQMGIGAVDNLVAISKGEKVAKAIDSGITFVTKDNIDKESN